MNRSLIETQIKAKVDVQIVDDDENPLNLDDFSVEVSRIREMKIGTPDIEIKYQIAYRATSNEDKLILDAQMELKLDDKNEIMAFEVINVKLSTISAEKIRIYF